jgi:sugar phosphate isomerase/epimerase
MLRVGPNPYGLCCTLGLQGKLEPPKDVRWFIDLAKEMRGRCIEFHFSHVAGIDSSGRAEIRDELVEASIEPIVSGAGPLRGLANSISVAKEIGARSVRTHLSPVLCGARAEQGEKWHDYVREVRECMAVLGPQFEDNALTLAIENHQDFGSEDLLEFCGIGGNAVGINLDTGNALAVGEEPVSFAKKVSHKVAHVHLKDYRAYATPQGFRLVRCAIGDGCVPLVEIVAELSSIHKTMTAALEPGALNSRHVQFLTAEWWNGYRARTEAEREACLSATKYRAIPPEEDWQTPWERGEDPKIVSQFEIGQMMKSVQNMQAMGWLLS